MPANRADLAACLDALGIVTETDLLSAYSSLSASPGADD